MKLQVVRYSSQTHSTTGLLSDITTDYKFLCYTLEDPKQHVKIAGNTCIPIGHYKLELRKEGGMNDSYSKRFGTDFHKGMLWVRHVYDFEYIYIHVGNTPEDTEGCLLVGNVAKNNVCCDDFVGSSSDAYTSIYPPIANAIELGEPVSIVYREFEYPLF